MTSTRVIRGEDAGAIATAVAVLHGGGLVAFPTDTVYGLGAGLTSAAIERLYKVKARSTSKAIAVLVADQDQVAGLAASIPRTAARLMQAFWPGPLTLVLPRRASLPAELGPQLSVGVRAPDHELARTLLASSGPLAVTSANLSGGFSPRSAQDVLDDLSGRFELLIDGGPTPGGTPSTVVDCLGEEPAIIRPGPVSMQALLAVIGADQSGS
jgi:L-threonylcarbamoyladenylate synthase